MGCVESTPQSKSKESERNWQLAQRLKKDQAANAEVFKLLLLGAGESGKSTVLKQMVQIYGDGFEREDIRRQYIHVIWLNVIHSMQALCRATEEFPLECAITDQGLLACRAEVMKTALSHAILYLPGAKFPAEQVEIYKRLWVSDPIQAAYQIRHKFQLIDSAKFFLDKLGKITHCAYLPDTNDIMHARMRTLGIQQSEFMIKGFRFNLVDVGGQRSERRKWMHCFADVTCVLYVVAISAFNQVLFEDARVNRIDESVHLFSTLVNSRWFNRTPIILFLNKNDLFREKLKTTSLTVWRPDYETWQPPLALWIAELETLSPDSKEEREWLKSKLFIQTIFQEQNWDKGRNIYVHATTATNTANIEYVFESVRKTILSAAVDNIRPLA
eukprot:gb/GEZN01003727.1/.p1 GENE.gb/GEZN01003727.1/~~gb/GEZN01003727.1/.p1  ORF type:complete len:386 (-),score=50.52 gb/GEZN01003727.1/:932-2089(-)